ncbi:hypothetical protein EDD90_4852 [Streptomyces sp. Ag109_O5-1]|uniref:hypothetical protein n=1 Tax=Streptomyces sp. Ag109_O5-1 TaxID=1938851 RepID=UPI000F9C47B4|nr:hypothetical protein [Streptomyces sp. Ag109_O5-1]RPE41760.1 hypothetical protein EDD90_4852 [Streptomyces sp. Ag109_O5-1]
MNHVLWAAGRPRARVFRHGTATAVAAPARSGRDRIAVAGEAADALPLVRDVSTMTAALFSPWPPMPGRWTDVAFRPGS